MIACASQTCGGIGARDSLQHGFLQADYTLRRAFPRILLLCPLLVRGDLPLGSPLLLAEVLPDQAFPEQKARETLCKTVSPPSVPGTTASPVSVEADLLQHSDINKRGGSLLLASQSMCTLNLPLYKLQCLCLIAFVLVDKLLSCFRGGVAHR